MDEDFMSSLSAELVEGVKKVDDDHGDRSLEELYPYGFLIFDGTKCCCLSFASKGRFGVVPPSTTRLVKASHQAEETVERHAG